MSYTGTDGAVLHSLSKDAILNGSAACVARKVGELLGNSYESSAFIYYLP